MFTPHQIAEMLATVPETHLDIIDIAWEYAKPEGGINIEKLTTDGSRLASALRDARNYISDVNIIKNNIQLLLKDKIQ